jgi:arylsulfatase A-like enzyme
VLDTLEAQGLLENTVICFTSDNGGVSSGDAYSSSMLPLRGGKGRQWEGGIREPFYIAWPGMIPAGTTCNVPVSGIDFYPTFLDLAGVPLPPEQVVDGLSLASLLRGEDDPALAGRDLFWHYPHYGNQGGEPSSIIQRYPWKLIHYYEDGRDELYQLENDPGEQLDQAAVQAELAATLRRRLDQWLHETGARFPEQDPEYDPDKAAERLHRIEHEQMPRLESQHAQFLDPDWEPNPDWWGSLIVRD